MSLNPRIAAVAALIAAVSAAGPAPPGPAPLEAQAAGDAGDGAEWFPGRTSFAPLLAAPREVGSRGGLFVVDREERPGDFAGTNVEAGVALGHRVGVVRLQRAGADRPEITLGFELGVFTRFFMETPEKDLIAADFRVGAPLSARWRGWRGRLTLLHASSHFGDDFVRRFVPPARQVTREGLELLVGRRATGALRLYAGAEWNFHLTGGVERTAARVGLEWDPDPGPPAGAARPGAGEGGAVAAPADGGDRGGRGGDVRAWPFAALDARATSLGGGATVSAASGVALRVSDVLLRLQVRAHAGPSPLGQLRTRDETAAGLELTGEL